MLTLRRLTQRASGLVFLVFLVASCSAALAFTSPEPLRADPPPRTPAPPTPDLSKVWPYVVVTPAPRQQAAGLFATLRTSLAPSFRSGQGVAGVLEERPADGEQVEVEAYFSGAGLVPHHRGPRPYVASTDCPSCWEAALTDRPFQGLLHILGGVHSNVLPANEAWLIAAPADAVWPGRQAVADLPYHARLRGYLGDPAFSHCSDSQRIFVVTEVLEVYEEEPPAAPLYALPEDYDRWPRHTERRAGYSLAYPPGWEVEVLDGATLALRAPQWPDWPILVRVHAGEIEEGGPSSPALLEGDSCGVYRQGTAFGAAQSPALSGYLVDRYTEPHEREVAVLFSGQGQTYELALRYPLGFDALQPLLTAYSAVVEGCRLDS